MVTVVKAPSRVAASAINTLTRSYDKGDSGYIHRIGSQAWLRNLGASDPLLASQQGKWQPLPASKIVVPNDSDVPILRSIWIPAETPAVELPWYKTIF